MSSPAERSTSNPASGLPRGRRPIRPRPHPQALRSSLGWPPFHTATRCWLKASLSNLKGHRPLPPAALSMPSRSSHPSTALHSRSRRLQECPPSTRPVIRKVDRAGPTELSAIRYIATHFTHEYPHALRQYAAGSPTGKHPRRPDAGRRQRPHSAFASSHQGAGRGRA